MQLLPLALMIKIIICLICTNTSATSTNVIYVDPHNGTMASKCWTGGIKLPCKTYDLAKKGASLLRGRYNVHVEVIASRNTSCEEQTWMRDSQNDTCRCGKSIKDSVSCYNDGVNVHVSILTCHCMTYDEEAGIVITGACPYGCGQSTDNFGKDIYYPLPLNVSKLNDKMCGNHKRESRFCGKCMEESSPLAYSYDLNCIKCKSRFQWLKFIAFAFIPLTVFYFIVLIFRIDATDPYLYGFITLCQAIASPVNLRAVFTLLSGKNGLVIRFLAPFYTLWNLDFFRSLKLNICLNLTTLQTLALDYAIAVYPLLLVVITYILIELHARGCRLILWLWRPFHRCCVRFTRIMDIKSSIIKAFATFLLLSYVKLINSTLDMLLPVKAYDVHGKVVGTYVYYDASYKYFSKEHRPYAIMAITFFIIFVLSPLFLLLFYPTACFQRFLNSHRLRSHALQVFVDAFQGHYKDGTEPGTHDCRWFAAVYSLARIIGLYVIFGISEDALCYSLTGIMLVFFVIFMVIVKPYRSSVINTYHISIVLYIAIICFSITTLDQASIKGRWFMKTIIIFIIFLVVMPILVVALYIVCLCALRWHFRSCKKAWEVLSHPSEELRKFSDESEDKLLTASVPKGYQTLNT